MKITIDTDNILKGAASGGIGALAGKLKKKPDKAYKGGVIGGLAGIKYKLLDKKLKEKLDRKAIESKARSPFEPLVRQQKVEAGLKKLRSLKK